MTRASRSGHFTFVPLIALLRFYEVFIKSDGSGKAVYFHTFVKSVHTLHLLRTENYGRKAEAVFAHRLIKLSVGGAGHNIGRAGQPGEGFGNDLFNGFIGFAVYVDGHL